MNDKNTPSNSLPQTDETPAAGLTLFLGGLVRRDERGDRVEEGGKRSLGRGRSIELPLWP